MLTRRTMLASVAATGLAVLAACTGRSPARSGDVPEPGTDGPALTAGERREVVLAADEFGMLNFPDGHLTYLATDAGYRMWLSSGLPDGGGRTVALDTADLVALRPADESGSDAVAGLVPPGGTVAFDSDYSAPGSVFPSADGSALWLIYHGENHTFAGVTNDGSPFYATIGLASSTDGGRSWTRRGAVVTGQVPRDDQPAPRDVVGSGSPCALVADDGYVYLLYIDWNLATPDELHLARAPLAAVDEPAAWQKWHQGSFSTPGAGGASTAVVTRPGDGDVTVVAGGPSLSWNTYLGRYVLVFQSADGFWWTHSTTLTDWAEPVRFLDLDAPAVRGAAFVAYGSLLSPGEASDRVTGQDGYLYLAIAESADDSHGLCRIATRFTAA